MDARLFVPPLRENDGQIYYDAAFSSEDRVSKIFLEEGSIIKETRNKLLYNSSIKDTKYITARQLLKLGSLTELGLSEYLRNNRTLSFIMGTLLFEKDFSGALPISTKDILHLLKRNDRKTVEGLYKLKSLELIGKIKKKPLKVTDKGKKIAYLSVKDKLLNRLKDLLNQKGFVDLLTLQKNTDVPPSIILEGLKELQALRITKVLEIDGHPNQIFWVVAGEETGDFAKNAGDLLSTLNKQIITILDSESYALGTIAILERARLKDKHMSYPIIKIILQGLKNKGIISLNEQRMWFYPLESKLDLLLRENPFDIYSLTEIARLSCSEQTEDNLNNILSAMKALERKGRVWEVSAGLWASFLSEKEKEYQIDRSIRGQCIEYIKRIISEHPSFNKERIKYEAIAFLLKEKEKFGFKGSCVEIVDEAVKQVICSYANS